MPVIRDPRSVPARRTTIYPAPFDKGFDKRAKRALTAALGLTQFGVNLTTLEPGGQSAGDARGEAVVPSSATPTGLAQKP